MNRKLAAALGGAALAAFASTSMGAEPGWYVSGQAGASFLNDADIEATDEGNALDSEIEHDVGFGVGGALGYDIGNGFRVEGEIGYRQNDLDEISGRGVSTPFEGEFSDGDMSALSFMANVFYDFYTQSPWKPYVGGGIGVAEVSINDAEVGRFSIGGMEDPERGGDFADDEDTVFAWQVGTGIGYEVNPWATVSLDYRYFATEDPSFTDPDGINFDSEYGSHNASVSLRYRF